MNRFKPAVLSGCLLALATSTAQALPAVVATFVADPGKTDMVYTMASCKKTKSEVYGHTITLREDGSFLQSMDLDGLEPVSPELVLSGAWSEPKPGRIEMMYDGDITEGALGADSWGAIITAAETALKPACGNFDIRLQYATIRIKKLTLDLNGKSDRGSLKADIDSYATGSNTRPGKASINIKASGNFQTDF